MSEYGFEELAYSIELAGKDQMLLERPQSYALTS